MPLDPALIKSTMSEMPSTEGLSNLAALGKTLSLEIAVAKELSEALAITEQKIQKLQDETIPEVMNALGLDEIKLSSGEKLSLVPVYSANISKEREQEALQWLRDNDYGALIKTMVNVSFGMGEDTKATLLKEFLQKSMIPAMNKQGVHASTLKAFVKERYEKGEAFPEKLFGAFTKIIAQIKQPK